MSVPEAGSGSCARPHVTCHSVPLGYTQSQHKLPPAQRKSKGFSSLSPGGDIPTGPPSSTPEFPQISRSGADLGVRFIVLTNVVGVLLQQLDLDVPGTRGDLHLLQGSCCRGQRGAVSTGPQLPCGPRSSISSSME